MACTTSVTVSEPEAEQAQADEGSPAQSIQAEIEALKCKHCANCKVIQNVGIFTHIVSAQLQDKDLTVKFQIDGEQLSLLKKKILISNSLVTVTC